LHTYPDFREALPYQHQPRVVSVRERIQQDSIDDAEDRSVCADPERKREHCDGGKGRASSQHPSAVTKVVQ
jgi:hypothetical protein